MREAVIVAARRTPVSRACKGAFNNTYGSVLGEEARRAAVTQAGLFGINPLLRRAALENNLDCGRSR